MKNIVNKIGPLSNIEFDKLFLSQLLSYFADAVVQFTLVAILLDKLPNAGKAIAITFFAFLLPQFFFSPYSGAFCDKFQRKNILANI